MIFNADMNTNERTNSRHSIIISWIGWVDGFVNQDVIRVRRGETDEYTVDVFAANAKVAKIVGWAKW